MPTEQHQMEQLKGAAPDVSHEELDKGAERAAAADPHPQTPSPQEGDGALDTPFPGREVADLWRQIVSTGTRFGARSPLSEDGT